MLLISVVGLPGLQNELGNLDGVEIMLKRFADSRAGANMRNDAVMILAKLCENHEDNQARLRRAHGVSLLIQEIDAYVKRRVPVTRSRHKNLSEAARDAMPSSSSAEKVDPLIFAHRLKNDPDADQDMSSVPKVDALRCKHFAAAKVPKVIDIDVQGFKTFDSSPVWQRSKQACLHVQNTTVVLFSMNILALLF